MYQNRFKHFLLCSFHYIIINTTSLQLVNKSEFRNVVHHINLRHKGILLLLLRHRIALSVRWLRCEMSSYTCLSISLILYSRYVLFRFPSSILLPHLYFFFSPLLFDNACLLDANGCLFSWFVLHLVHFLLVGNSIAVPTLH